MESLIGNLGLNWKLLLSQAVNFLILLVVLRLTVYRPLLELMRKRRERIEEGLQKADEADKRLHEVTQLQKEKIKEAEEKGLALITAAQERAKEKEHELLAQVAKKQEEILARAKEQAAAEQEAAYKKAEGRAVELVKEVLIKVVSVSPSAVDDALVQKAADAARAHHRS